MLFASSADLLRVSGKRTPDLAGVGAIVLGTDGTLSVLTEALGEDALGRGGGDGPR